MHKIAYITSKSKKLRGKNKSQGEKTRTSDGLLNRTYKPYLVGLNPSEK